LIVEDMSKKDLHLKGWYLIILKFIKWYWII